VHHRDDGNTLPTEPPEELEDLLNELQGLCGAPTYDNSQKGGQTDFEINTDLNGKIPFHSPYLISPREEEQLQRQIDKAIR
jgi:hypothetical protein